MGKMQCALKQLLSTEGMLSERTLRVPRADDVGRSHFSHEVQDVYRQLGGIRPSFPLNLGCWDMEFEGIAIELDECLHFNRYRAITLASIAYTQLSRFPLSNYQRYCSHYEDECLRGGGYGGKWSNPSCVAQFGAASPPKDLTQNGSPRWRQRAFYDFVKDLSPLIIGVTVIRVAVWDTVVEDGYSRTVAEVLTAPSHASGAALASLLRERGTQGVPF